MKRLSYFTLFSGFLCVFIASQVQAQSLRAALKYLEAEVFHTLDIDYPYMADSAREAGIHGNMNQLETGLSVDSVREFMGMPDEINPVFTRGDRSNVISSFEYVYLFSRDRANEWGREFNEKSITVGFNMTGLLISASGVELPTFREVVREQGLGFEFEMGIGESVMVDDLLIVLKKIEIEEIEGAPESADSAVGKGSTVTCAMLLPDRKGEISLSLVSKTYRGENSGFYGAYKLTLVAVPATDRVLFIVE